MADNIKIDPNDLFNTVMKNVFTPAVDRNKAPITEEAIGTKISAIKFDLEREIFDVLAKFDIPRDKALGAVANFIQNLNRLK